MGGFAIKTVSADNEIEITARQDLWDAAVGRKMHYGLTTLQTNDLLYRRKRRFQTKRMYLLKMEMRKQKMKKWIDNKRTI